MTQIHSNEMEKVWPNVASINENEINRKIQNRLRTDREEDECDIDVPHIYYFFYVIAIVVESWKKRNVFSSPANRAYSLQFNRVLAVHRVLISVGCFTFPIDVVYANFSVFYSSVWFNEIP